MKGEIDSDFHSDFCSDGFLSCLVSVCFIISKCSIFRPSLRTYLYYTFASKKPVIVLYFMHHPCAQLVWGSRVSTVSKLRRRCSLRADRHTFMSFTCNSHHSSIDVSSKYCPSCAPLPRWQVHPLSMVCRTGSQHTPSWLQRLISACQSSSWEGRFSQWKPVRVGCEWRVESRLRQVAKD